MNKRLLFIVVVLLLLNIQPVAGGYLNENYLVTNIDKCYDNILIKVRGNAGRNVYDFIPCKPGSAKLLWQCQCKEGNTEIFFRTNVTSQYDIVVEYHIYPLTNDEIKDDNSRRTLNFNNVKFVPKPLAQKIFDWPKNTSIFVVILVVLMILGGLAFGIYILVKKFMMSEWNDDELNSKEEKKELKREDDSLDEIEKILKDI